MVINRTKFLSIVICLLMSTNLIATDAALALDSGDRAPDFARPALGGGGTVELSQFRGKVVYLDFWASWCAPCLTAILEIEKMRGEFPTADLQPQPAGDGWAARRSRSATPAPVIRWAPDWRAPRHIGDLRFADNSRQRFDTES